MTEPSTNKRGSDLPRSDLKTRFVSAVLMVAVAATALWTGGWIWAGFVGLVALGLLWEWWQLSRKLAGSAIGKLVWVLFGLLYALAAGFSLIKLREIGLAWALIPLVLVIATDVGAYFSGRAIGGPKIAPSISPSKTWAGLVGGAVLAMVIVWLVSVVQPALVPIPDPRLATIPLLLIGLLAILAQMGDFFESWMKRRAGVKDSSNLIPGHGGIFDRVDGLLPVAIAFLAITHGPVAV